MLILVTKMAPLQVITVMMGLQQQVIVSPVIVDNTRNKK